MKTKYDNCCKCNGSMEGGSVFTEGGERFCFCRPCTDILNRCNPNSNFRVFSFLKSEEHIPFTPLEKADLDKRRKAFKKKRAKTPDHIGSFTALSKVPQKKAFEKMQERLKDFSVTKENMEKDIKEKCAKCLNPTKGGGVLWNKECDRAESFCKGCFLFLKNHRDLNTSNLIGNYLRDDETVPMTIVERDMLYARIRRNTGLSPWELDAAKLKGSAKKKPSKTKEKEDETK